MYKPVSVVECVCDTWELWQDASAHRVHFWRAYPGIIAATPLWGNPFVPWEESLSKIFFGSRGTYTTILCNLGHGGRTESLWPLKLCARIRSRAASGGGISVPKTLRKPGVVSHNQMACISDLIIGTRRPSKIYYISFGGPYAQQRGLWPKLSPKTWRFEPKPYGAVASWF